MKPSWIVGLGLTGLALAGGGIALAQAARPMLDPRDQARLDQNTAARNAALAQPRTMMVTRLPTTVLRQNAGDKAAVNQLRISPATLSLRQQVTGNRLLAANVDLAAVDRVKTPVLVPSKASLVGSLRVFPSENRFTASSSEPGVVVEVVGTKTPFVAPRASLLLNKGLLLKPMIRQPVGAQLAPQIEQEPASPPVRKPPPPRMRVPYDKTSLLKLLLGGPAYAQPLAAAQTPATPAGEISNIVVERTEYGVDVSFSRFGSVYNLTIACDLPDTDPRCSDASAVSTAKGLQILGGGEQ